jgi:predicted RNase H-like HicB family nuclease
MGAGSHEGQPSAVPSSVEGRNGDRCRKAECRHSAGNPCQRAAASRTREVRVRMDYVVIIEKGNSSFGAYVPDLPGCVAVGETREEAMKLIREAIEFHIEGLKEDGLPVPVPSSTIQTVRVAA